MCIRIFLMEVVRHERRNIQREDESLPVSEQAALGHIKRQNETVKVPQHPKQQPDHHTSIVKADKVSSDDLR